MNLRIMTIKDYEQMRLEMHFGRRWDLQVDVNVNIKMFKKWKIKMYSFPTFIPQLVPPYRLAFL